MDNRYNYRVAVCPYCKQGLVEIVKEIDTNDLFVCCNECEIEWSEPREVLNESKGTRNKYGKTTEPTFEEVNKKGWRKYIIKR